MSGFPDPGPALKLVEQIVCIGGIISSLEWLAISSELKATGLFSWNVLGLRGGWARPGRAAAALGSFFQYPAVVLLPAARLVLATWLLFGAHSEAERTVAVVALSALTMLLHARMPLGLDGSDHMVAVILTASAVGRLLPSEHGRTAAVVFIGLQGCTAYAASGWAKTMARGWRNGVYLRKVLATSSFGAPGLVRVFRSRWLPAFLSRGLLIWECSFPAVLLLPGPGTYAFLGIGLVFHLSSAALMGLNTFVWSFLAIYPAILYCKTVERAALSELFDRLWHTG